MSLDRFEPSACAFASFGRQLRLARNGSEIEQWITTYVLVPESPPLDTDGDGVLDDLDLCPAVAADDLFGCPPDTFPELQSP